MDDQMTISELTKLLLGHEYEYEMWSPDKGHEYEYEMWRPDKRVATYYKRARLGDWDGLQSWLNNEPHDIPKVGIVQIVESFGGEGMGDQLWYVFSVVDPPKPTRYFKVSGYYQSYDGGTYEDGEDALSEVAPVQKVVTVYE